MDAIGRWARGEVTLREARGWTLEMMDGARWLGLRLLCEGRTTDAAIVRDYLLALDSGCRAGHLLAAAIAERARDWEAAFASYGRAVLADGENTDARAGRARVALRLGRPAVAREDYEVVARGRAPEAVEARVFLATAR